MMNRMMEVVLMMNRMMEGVPVQMLVPTSMGVPREERTKGIPLVVKIVEWVSL
jgi:hypothetical protein